MTACVLSADRFTTIATEGLGRESSGTAGSMVYFRDSVFVGTVCGNPITPSDAPRILRHDVESGTWTTAYESPLIDPHPRSHVRERRLSADGGAPDHRHRAGAAEKGNAAGKIPRDFGYRSMCVFQGKSDRTPALYLSTISRTGAIILRSTDGEAFEPVSEPGLGDPSVYSFRGLVEFNGWLFASPAGTVTNTYLDRNLPRHPQIYVSNDPLKGKWFEAAESGFGDASNVAIYSVHPALGRLYAGTANPDLGCQVWQTEARGKPPFDWSPVIVNGGGAFNTNFTVAAMAEFNGALYAGIGITGFGYETAHDLGPASGELWRIHPDGCWDLIAGRMRFTPHGLKVPLSLLGPGLGDFYNSMVRSLVTHHGVLYLGTFQWEAYRCFEINSPKVVGGYQLWASIDGESWTPVLEDGNGSPADLGIASLLSTPHGLFAGTSNQSGLFANLTPRLGEKFDFKPGFKVLRGN
jgi:hypothetical protein